MRILITAVVLIAVPAGVGSAAKPQPAPLVVLDPFGKKLRAISRTQRRRLERAISYDLSRVEAARLAARLLGRS